MNVYIFDVFLAGAYSINYNTDMLQKNFNADMTNPNIYHSIDDNFEDHVYAEIKHKDGYIGKNLDSFMLCKRGEKKIQLNDVIQLYFL